MGTGCGENRDLRLTDEISVLERPSQVDDGKSCVGTSGVSLARL